MLKYKSRLQSLKCGPEVAAAAAGAAINSAGGLVGGLLANHQAKKTREFNAEQAQLNREYQTSERIAAQEFDLDMWNLNNEYNSLENQIARARAAGVNPNAILGGDYKTPTSSPVTTTPMSGNAATDSSGGSLGSAFINAGSNIGNSIGNFVKNMMDSKVAIKQVQLNEKMINSNIDHNLASIQKLFSDVGVNDASAEQIKKATSWMDKRNDVEIQEIAARVTNWYNQNNKILQEIKNLEANEKLTDSQTTYQETLNTYADRQQSAFTTQAESDAAISALKSELAKAIGVPVDSPEFLFNWKLAINGKFEEYCDKVIMPKTQATWRPSDRMISYDTKHGIKLFSLDFGGYSGFSRTFDDPSHRKTIIKPHVADGLTYVPELGGYYSKDFIDKHLKK